ncbi:MAG: heparinase II/III family protein [Alphaproteobacteria bacterium]|nr:MAG: heparinase II/III family protein [Alphaproteobacteria bacterium]
MHLETLAFANPIYRLTLGGPVPQVLAVVPSDPWPGDAGAGQAILEGAFRFAGQSFCADPADWLPVEAQTPWVSYVHGFDWLRDLRAVGGDEARRRARHLVSSWLDSNTLWNRVAWTPSLVGARLANWVVLHDFFCASADDAFRHRVFDSLSRQTRHLARIMRTAPRGPGRFAAIHGLLLGALNLTDSEAMVSQALAGLHTALAEEILPDGGHISRCPLIQAQLLERLVEIRVTMRTAKLPVPADLQNALDWMAPALRLMRHGDGGLALFNGGIQDSPERIEAILAQAEPRPRALKSLRESGFERLSAGRSVVLLDVGLPPPAGFDGRAHAGPLSFEVSVGRERIITNCGAMLHDDPDWRMALAATAAHSTLTVAETNAAEVLPQGGIGRRPARISCQRSEQNGTHEVEASHDGYLTSFGLRHHRSLSLSSDGEELRGEDMLEGTGGHSFALRFHLQPGVQASLIQEGVAVLLRLTNGHGWRLTMGEGGLLALEESINLADGISLRRAQQVVAGGVTQDGSTRLCWTLARERRAGGRDSTKTAAAPLPAQRDLVEDAGS